MNSKIIKPGIFILAYAITLVLYWPSMHGPPIWDDITYWFSDPVMTPKMSYLTILKDFAWPTSVAIQKFTFSLWKDNYFNYHLFSLCLHFANSLLIYKLGRLLRLKNPFIYFALFLFHPVSVISTAWMIQNKTLLCFFFGLCAFFAFIKGNKDLRWMILSWVLFLLSITSKSASLTLPIIFLFFSIKNYKFKKLLLLIPFFIFSAWGTYKVLVSPVTLEGTLKATKVTQLNEVLKELPEAKGITAVPNDLIKPKGIVEAPPEIKPSPPEPSSPLNFISIDLKVIAQTLHYYFWQSVLPMQNVPVKGPQYDEVGAAEIVHVFFLCILVIGLWKDVALLYLASAHLLLLPFLGIIPAPFMSVTWVSDQHLYLVLPCLLAFWMRILSKVKLKYSFILPSLFILLFSYKTAKTTPIYSSQFRFYETSYEYNPYNIPIAYNLSFAYAMNRELYKAYTIASDTFHRGQSEPRMKKNLFYPHIVKLYLQLRSTLEKDEN
jgi:hypothetical protein